MKSITKYKLLLLILVFLGEVSIGQTTYQVVTRKIEKEFEFFGSDYLIVNAEKGIITIQPCNEMKISVVANIVVKNKDLNIAKKELEYLKWDAFRKNKELHMTNTILLPQNYVLSSIVRVEYTIFVPQGVHFSIYNKFGKVNVSNLTCVSKYNLQYCDMKLENISGTTRITSNVGDLYLTDVRGELQMTSRYSTLQISNFSGNGEISATYGDIKVNLADAISLLNITAERCDVFISNKNCKEINLNLETKFGEMNLMESCYIKNKTLVKKEKIGTIPNTTSIYNYAITGKVPYLKVKSVYGNISLN